MRLLFRPRGPLAVVVLANLLVAGVVAAALLGTGEHAGDATQQRPAAQGTSAAPAGDGDLYASAVAASRKDFPSPPVRVVFVVTGADTRDAMIAAPAAALLGGPVLPVTEDGIPAVIAQELRRLDPGRIVVLGGVAAVSSDVEAELASMTEGGVTRLAGTNRFETAAAAATTLFTPPVPQVLVVIDSGADLAAPPALGRAVRPTLLVTAQGVPSQTAAALRTLRPRSIVVLGAPSDALLAGLRGYTSGPVSLFQQDL